MITLVHLITGLDAGGAERMLARLAARFDRGRFRSLVVSLTDAGSTAPLLAEAGVECLSLGLARGLPDPRGLLRLDRILRQIRPDILQTWLYHADFLGVLAKLLQPAPCLIWNVRCSDMRLPPMAGMLRRLLARLSAVPAAVIVNSRAGQRFHEAIGYRPRRWQLIPNGFDTGEFAPDAEARRRLRAEFGLAENAVAIGLPARYHPMKDHASFFAAARLLAAAEPQARFVLIGAGTEKRNPDFARALAASGVAGRAVALGERGDMPAIYAALDIATLCSMSGEGFPNVLGEAMACGVPCAATDTGDAAAVIGATGLVVPPRDPAALTAAWQALIERGPEGRRALGLAARARIARDFELDGVVARYTAFYEDILARGAAAAWSGSRAA